mgnify:CR=1 FL=1
MMALWLIESGSYSAYQVLAVFDGDETGAKAVIDGINSYGVLDKHDQCGYSEVPAIRSADDVRLEVTHYFRMERLADGTVTSSPWSYTSIEFGERDEPDTVNGSAPDRYGRIVVVAASADPERAIKMASDRMAQLRAEHELDPQPSASDVADQPNQGGTP